MMFQIPYGPYNEDPGADQTQTAQPGTTNYAPYMTLAGGAFTSASQFQAGQNSAAYLRANAAIAGMQGRGELEAGAESAELYRQHLNQRLGVQRAAIGGSGLTTSGSALRGLETTSELGAQDIARIQTNAARKAWGFDVTEQGDLLRARNASAAGTSNAVGGFIGTAARAYGQWSME